METLTVAKCLSPVTIFIHRLESALADLISHGLPGIIQTCRGTGRNSGWGSLRPMAHSREPNVLREEFVNRYFSLNGRQMASFISFLTLMVGGIYIDWCAREELNLFARWKPNLGRRSGSLARRVTRLNQQRGLSVPILNSGFRGWRP